jgi:hypothetical protein
MIMLESLFPLGFSFYEKVHRQCGQAGLITLAGC